MPRRPTAVRLAVSHILGTKVMELANHALGAPAVPEPQRVHKRNGKVEALRSRASPSRDRLTRANRDDGFPDRPHEPSRTTRHDGGEAGTARGRTFVAAIRTAERRCLWRRPIELHASPCRHPHGTDAPTRHLRPQLDLNARTGVVT
jgi:hypothetical protein